MGKPENGGAPQGRLHDSTLTFQMKQGFAVLAVVSQYLRHDARFRGSL